MSYDSELATYYKNLLIIQYSGKDKAAATIQALVEKVIIFDLLSSIQDGFDPDTAVGAQLDIIGKYVGVSRELYMSLSDDDYRFLIKMAIVKNSSNGSLKEIDYLFNYFFSGEIIVFDNYDMSIVITYESNLSSIITIANTNGLIPKPAGVSLTLTVLTDVINEIWYTRVTINNSDLTMSYNQATETMTITGTDIIYDMYIIGYDTYAIGYDTYMIGTDSEQATITY